MHRRGREGQTGSVTSGAIQPWTFKICQCGTILGGTLFFSLVSVSCGYILHTSGYSLAPVACSITKCVSEAVFRAVTASYLRKVWKEFRMGGGGSFAIAVVSPHLRLFKPWDAPFVVIQRADACLFLHIFYHTEGQLPHLRSPIALWNYLGG